MSSTIEGCSQLVKKQYPWWSSSSWEGEREAEKPGEMVERRQKMKMQPEWLVLAKTHAESRSLECKELAWLWKDLLTWQGDYFFKKWLTQLAGWGGVSSYPCSSQQCIFPLVYHWCLPCVLFFIL